MSAKVTIHHIEATFHEGLWTSADGLLADTLNGHWDLEAPDDYAPNADQQAAEWARARFGAEIVEVDKVSRKKGRIY